MSACTPSTWPCRTNVEQGAFHPGGLLFFSKVVTDMKPQHGQTHHVSSSLLLEVVFPVLSCFFK